MSQFSLNPAFDDKLVIDDFHLSKLILNSTKIPWMFLIPMRNDITQINHLSEEDQFQLMREINLVSNVMESLFPCDRLNVAAIGNKTAQLHIHIICRTKNDPYWPETLWQYSCEKLHPNEYMIRSQMIKSKLIQVNTKLLTNDHITSTQS